MVLSGHHSKVDGLEGYRETTPKKTKSKFTFFTVLEAFHASVTNNNNSDSKTIWNDETKQNMMCKFEKFTSSVCNGSFWPRDIAVFHTAAGGLWEAVFPFFAFSRFSSTFQHYTVQKANVLYIKTGQWGHILRGLKQCRGLGNPPQAVGHSRFHIAAGLWEAVFPCFSHVRGFPARPSTTPCRKQMFYTSKKVNGGIFGEV